ncbi:MAG: Rab family GTPase [Promethearchaeota archaeon]
MINDLTFKISLFGEGEVGKTTLAKRYMTGLFEGSLRLTLGADIHIKYLDLKDHKIILQIWDFGGGAAFTNLLPSYSRGSFGGLFMYDISNLDSLNAVDKWLNIFQDGLMRDNFKVPLLLVGGKNDLEPERKVTIDTANLIREKYGFFDLIECSSLTGENVDKVFETIVLKIMKLHGYVK